MSTEHKQDWLEVAIGRLFADEDLLGYEVWYPDEPRGHEYETYLPASKLQAVREELERRAEVEARTVANVLELTEAQERARGAERAYREAAQLLGEILEPFQKGESDDA